MPGSAIASFYQGIAGLGGQQAHLTTLLYAVQATQHQACSRQAAYGMSSSPKNPHKVASSSIFRRRHAQQSIPQPFMLIPDMAC